MHDNERRHPFVVEHGEVFHAGEGGPVRSAAIMLDRSTGTVHSAGEAAYVQGRYDQLAKFPALSQDVVMVTLDPCLGPDAICYALNRCVEHSASDFAARLADRLEAGGLKAWLEDEMRRVPLN